MPTGKLAVNGLIDLDPGIKKYFVADSVLNNEQFATDCWKL